jgi:Fe-S oxidoreductase
MTVVGRVLLLVFIGASVLLFIRRFKNVLLRILGARKTGNFVAFSVSKRLWLFFSEVVCQSKVIRERPLPGLLHAFVFWGFCAFALVTINHVASAFGVVFLRRDTTFGAFYFWFAFAFAACCAFSIAALAFRRFIIRPKWLEPVSYESGFIAFLIFALMVTYMPTWWVSDDSSVGRVLWWSHTLALLIFLPLIPHTKHLHLLLSPFAIFFKREGFSQIPPLSGDEDFGLVAGKDITQIVALQAYSCVECGRCTEHCPANNTGKELNPKLIALGMRDYLNESGPRSEVPILEASISQKAIFQCTTCGACEYQCPVGIQHLPMIVGLRRGAVNTGAWEDEYGTKLFLNLERNGNALGFAQSERDKFIAKQQWPVFDGGQEYCLWLGCMGAYDPRGREIVIAFAKVMGHLGTTFGILKKERCTGDPARRLGNDLVFSQLAETNGAALKQAGVKKIVSICPHCVRTMAEDWREFGVECQIEHHSEFMARHAARLPSAPAASKIVYHDPCYLGRYRNVYDEPREVIALSAEVVEPPRARERSFCCGAGGGLVFLGEESGERVNHARAKELVATGADMIGAACPFCNSMFRDALGKESGGPPVLDIAQIVAGTLGG